ncbi:hypothetical protein [Peribacillus frigoritolerans]|uniref:hypothetical protein n=1 Tax=Peribacillus frigoritolerans TaxID=450367 RepID=UPI0007BEA9C7|nr:hypothetical protein [Peribacillus frigoritolerans]MCM3169465.1 hypothetical protein [Peribacillus frigoritolerans]
MVKLIEEKKKPRTGFIEKRNDYETPTTSIFDEKNLKKMQKTKEKKIKIKSSIADIIPVIDMTANGYFELRNHEYMEIIQLTSKDIYSSNADDKNHDIYSFAFFLQSFLDDFKIVPLNFPVDTSVQQRFIQRKIEKAKNPIFIPFLEKKLQELQFIESNRTNREYYLFIYSDNEYTLTNKLNQVERLLQRTTPVIRLSDEKKINILYKLFNLNSKNKK